MKGLNDLLIEVARRVPAFGGMFIDEEGRLAVYLLDVTQGAAAEEAIAAIFGRERIPRGGTRVLQGRYSFLQLEEWYGRLQAVFEVPGVSFTDIDEANNRLAIGLEEIEKRDMVERKVGELGIPLEAVQIEETGPIRPVDGLS
ncbi:MAG: hypothetical protein M1337_07005 [Actinobacteria bacterium]|nr:hypothetical protein [Actinomycetota bacterium]